MNARNHEPFESPLDEFIRFVFFELLIVAVLTNVMRSTQDYQSRQARHSCPASGASSKSISVFLHQFDSDPNSNVYSLNDRANLPPRS